MMVYFNDVVLLLTVSMNINWSERFDDKIINWSVYKCMCVYVVQIGGFLYLFRQQWISTTTTVRITRREKANGWKEMSLLSKHFVRSFFFVEIMADRFLAATLILLTPSFTQMLHTVSGYFVASLKNCCACVRWGRRQGRNTTWGYLCRISWWVSKLRVFFPD